MLADFTDLLRGIKKAASGTVEADKPVAVIFGTVTNVDPLEISIEQKMTLSGSQLILTRTVKNKFTKLSASFETGSALTTHAHFYRNNTHIKNIPHTHDMPHIHDFDGNTGYQIPQADDIHYHEYVNVTENITDATQSSDPAHAHEYEGDTEPVDLSHSHGVSLTNSNAVIHDALEVGDEVVLLRMQGGQRFVVIDKL